MKIDKKKKKSKFLQMMLVTWIAVIILNIAAWFSSPFCTWYADHVTIIRVNILSRLTNLAPFSVGEIMLTIAVFLILLALITLVMLIFLHRHYSMRRFACVYFRTLFVIFTCICILMTLNCTILYHADFIDANPDAAYREYTVKELDILGKYVTEKCNEYSELMLRDKDGYLVYDGDMQETARAAMNNISSVYPRLKGYYPNVKSMMYSALMCQMDMAGYYFPFSLEANCNSYMYIKNFPFTYCHELSHLHGYIYEDEANFLGFLACINSDDEFFVYSGYMSILNYVRNACLNNNPESALPATNELVNRDNIFLTEEIRNKVEENAIIDTDTVEQISNTFTDSTLKINGVDDGIASYNRVVGLLLEYYDGVLY